MTLADNLAQYHEPFAVVNNTDGEIVSLDNAADWANVVAECPHRYVLRDDLTRLCADLAYSKGSGAVACADLLHIPARTLWIEWCNDPWQRALQCYGFPVIDGCQWIGRRGCLIHASADGRRGTLRTFWNGEPLQGVSAGSVESYFDFDTSVGEEPEPPDGRSGRIGRVHDGLRVGNDVLGTCFRFRYERSWENYYASANLPRNKAEVIWRHCLGTIAMDVPMVLAFLLLMATRTGLPQVPQDRERVNRRRRGLGKPPLLEHIEVTAPLLPQYRGYRLAEQASVRRQPRLHHVRGHLVRRGSQIFWRVPHLRGHARTGTIRSRTVVWTFDRAHAGPS